ncbi:MAG: hypothetical protein K2W96_13590, partial [Gemmataceae bacterium]|nr:hypothetical protein [Gemmataceae bacterium]
MGFPRLPKPFPWRRTFLLSGIAVLMVGSLVWCGAGGLILDWFARLPFDAEKWRVASPSERFDLAWDLAAGALLRKSPDEVEALLGPDEAVPLYWERRLRGLRLSPDIGERLGMVFFKVRRNAGRET